MHSTMDGPVESEGPLPHRDVDYIVQDGEVRLLRAPDKRQSILAPALVAPVAATLVQVGISWSGELAADETAANLTGEPTAPAFARLRLEQDGSMLLSRAEPAVASAPIASR